ncbi:glycosyltransferase family 39 protein [uncultured Sulfitobacter sp.]|uniref:glycosyltransferase family 39 protein n=1 Tax=uncultured Sulfitobacter sp. TaxID=191468 RepID=UPI002631A632|nr:glycosyltransferase family 39 protein [uncultured Sulfitobacter sp.]
MPTKIHPALPFVALIFLLVFGASQRSIWYDEAITLQTLAADRFVMGPTGFVMLGDVGRYFDGTTTLSELIQRYAETDVHPPLYFVLLHFAGLVFGGGLMAARAVSIALVALSVWLYWRALGRTGTAHRSVYAAVFALSFAMVSSAQDARGYALALLCATAAWSLAALCDTPRTNRERVWLEAGVGLACAALLYTHYFALFVVVPILGWRTLRAIGDRRALALIGPAVCAVLFAPWVPVLLEQMTTRPGQMTGFSGIVDWFRGASNFVPAQVFSLAWPDAPEWLQARGRDLVLLAMIGGAAKCLWTWRDPSAFGAFSRLALWVPATGIALFLAASIVMDRWFMTFRYFVFFAPFLAFLAAHGALWAGAALRRAGGGGRPWLKVTPAAILIAAQCAALNFGWEAIGTRGGNYFPTMRQQIEAAGPQDSLVIIDTGTGRGTLLAAAHALPRSTPAYLLDPDPESWRSAAPQIAARAQSRSLVLLVYTIERGAMGSDKAALYLPIQDALTAAGFIRSAAPPGNRGGRYYARWVRKDATG